MNPDNSIEIALSKKKILLLWFGSLVFVVAGCWFLFDPPTVRLHPAFIRIVGAASILFFGAAAIAYTRAFFQKKTGLTINGEGITDRSSAVSAGLVPWDDISKIEVFSINNQKFLAIHVKTPLRYIERQKNLLKRQAMSVNYKMYETPIQITANPLKIKFDDLERIVRQKFAENQ